jgi:polyhydroxyalkanoate synthesis repressor PhaR
MDKVVKIKKYGNRRFYSSDEKKYITIVDIQKLILKGVKVQIVDAESDKDITSDILTQILLEQGRATHFPVELLEQLIRTSEKSLNTVWAPVMSQQFKMMTQMGEMALQGIKAIISPLEKAAAGKSAPSPRKKSKKS